MGEMKGFEQRKDGWKSNKSAGYWRKMVEQEFNKKRVLCKLRGEESRIKIELGERQVELID